MSMAITEVSKQIRKNAKTTIANLRRLFAEQGSSDNPDVSITISLSEFRTLEALLLEHQRLHKLVNTPEIIDFAKAVQLESVFQREAWPAEGDAGKTDADWLWLLGYLSSKALHNPDTTPENALEKKLHRIITIAAACCNWHAAWLGKTNMRPGIEPPLGLSA
jgi:hypothetical protein